MGEYKRHTAEFRQEALALAESLGNVSTAAEELGIGKNTLFRWKRQSENTPHGSKFSPEKTVRPAPAQSTSAEVRRLEKELRELREDYEILKKAVAIFSRNP